MSLSIYWRKLRASFTCENKVSTCSLSVLSISVLAGSVRLPVTETIGLPRRGPDLWIFGKL